MSRELSTVPHLDPKDRRFGVACGLVVGRAIASD
jgi:hypothetical protein